MAVMCVKRRESTHSSELPPDFVLRTSQVVSVFLRNEELRLTEVKKFAQGNNVKKPTDS